MSLNQNYMITKERRWASDMVIALSGGGSVERRGVNMDEEISPRCRAERHKDGWWLPIFNEKMKLICVLLDLGA